MVSKVDYVELGLTCADVCEALDLGIDRRQADELNHSILEGIEKLTKCVELEMHTPDEFPHQVPQSGLWPRFKGTSSNGVNGIRSLDAIMQKTIKKRLLPGG